MAHRRFPFWGKTHSILGQNAFHFGAKRIPFWGKTHSILGQNAFKNFRNLNKKIKKPVINMPEMLYKRFWR